MSYLLHPEAEIEFTEAALYYAEHASNIIASAFVTEFERVVALLELNQKLGTPALEGLRVYPFHRFPYSLVYRENDFGPRVYAVSHQSREPRYWQGRL
ncbi:MAG: type II toxin-antitoxin system RelE/ParE family toxin [Propionivibrio sp.]|uniref:type II toxin-antitoxin system RelE/ParE family toxin n=1 Tax=Propionivibrio sp. TaxID=2212460 RepID=UPI001A5722E0|nr:type II toxin-antitoxin system RelE/ParE family toxin [Propionivibrio sp.]MBL8413590.1 type II toxin-antitoxin system RelE/ParE family toxin [Propionivibrio sp.]